MLIDHATLCCHMIVYEKIFNGNIVIPYLGKKEHKISGRPTGRGGIIPSNRPTWKFYFFKDHFLKAKFMSKSEDMTLGAYLDYPLASLGSRGHGAAEAAETRASSREAVTGLPCGASYPSPDHNRTNTRHRN